MKPEEVLEKIKENLKNKKELSKEDFRKNIQEIFIKFMGYENNTQIVYDDKSEKLYTCIIDTKIIIGAYRKETRIRALNLFSTYIKSKYEWGILIHPEGIWVFNDDIELGNDEFKSNKIVFEMPFNKRRDANYFKYLTYENLLEEKISVTLDGKSKELENMDMKKLGIMINHTIKGKNALRNKALILLLISFGMTRRKICSLSWEENISENCDGLYYGKNDNVLGERMIPFPIILKKAMQELRECVPGNAKYIFGNYVTEYQKPIKEQNINEILASLYAKNKNDKFYKLLTTENIRKWLFRYLMKEGYSLQYIMTLMDVPITSLENYVKDDEIKESAFKRMSEEHPLEKFWKEVNRYEGMVRGMDDFR